MPPTTLLTLTKLTTLLILLIIPTATSTPLSRRSVIAHDAVVGFPQSVPSTDEGVSALKYKPWLEVRNGCVPFPAVDAGGNTGGGLSTSGAPNGKCGQSLGQVYTRSAWYKDKYAIMYSWYMPKDSPSPGLGHRHDWENALIWLTSPDPTSQTLLAIATSAHGKYDTFKEPFLSMITDANSGRPKIQYFSVWPVNHQLGVTLSRGGEQPMVAWEELSEAARRALEETDFGSATVPFKEGRWLAELEKGYAAL